VVLTDAAVAVLRSLPLDGNVRALQSLLIRAIGRAVVERADEVHPRHLDGLDGVTLTAAVPADYRDVVRAYERQLLERALAAADGNQTRARMALGLSNGAWDRAKKRAGL
jgi:transcriptional regulator with PAS, ATPase and Fis domain